MHLHAQPVQTSMDVEDIILAQAMKWVDTPYIWGGQSVFRDGGVDCSGLVGNLKTIEGEFIGDTTAQGFYFHYRNKGHIETGFPQFGDLLFYGKSKNQISHVAYSLGNGIIIESGGGNKTTKTVEIARKQNACVRLKPIGHRKDLVSILTAKDNVIQFSKITKKQSK